MNFFRLLSEADKDLKQRRSKYNKIIVQFCSKLFYQFHKTTNIKNASLALDGKD